MAERWLSGLRLFRLLFFSQHSLHSSGKLGTYVLLKQRGNERFAIDLNILCQLVVLLAHLLLGLLLLLVEVRTLLLQRSVLGLHDLGKLGGVVSLLCDFDLQLKLLLYFLDNRFLARGVSRFQFLEFLFALLLELVELVPRLVNDLLHARVKQHALHV